jgi:hypothetical protein
MIYYSMHAYCDGCRRSISPDFCTTSLDNLKVVVWEWRDKWKKEGVVSLERVATPTKLFCNLCADKEATMKEET